MFHALAPPPRYVAVDGCCGVVDSHGRVTIESVAPIEVDVECGHDDADNPEGYAGPILEPDVYQAEYRGQYVEPVYAKKLHLKINA